MSHGVKKLTRSVHNRKIAGVGAGVAHYLGIDPAVVRLIMVLLFIISGFVPLVVIYFAAVVLVPEDIHDAS